MRGNRSGNEPKRTSAAGAAALLSLLFLGVCRAHSLDLTVGGSYKSFLVWSQDIEDRAKAYGAATGALRLDGHLSLASWLSLELAYVLSPEILAPVSGAAGLPPAASSDRYRVIDAPSRLLPVSEGDLENIALYQEIDRAEVVLHLAFADVQVGRQAISWGSARVVNPTDILVPFGLTALDTEYRSGVDALRVRIPLGALDELDVGYVAGADLRFEHSAAYVRTRLNLLQTDVAVLGAVFRQNLLVGLDLARAIGGAGVWVQGAYVAPGIADASGVERGGDYFGLSAGCDYSLAANLYAYLEYDFNSAGRDRPQDYLASLAEPAHTEGNVYLLGRHYLGIGGTYNIGPLLPLSLLLMVNLSDLSAEGTLSLEYNFKENVYIAGGFLVGLGAAPELSGGTLVAYRSEFGAYPFVVYAAVKVYF